MPSHPIRSLEIGPLIAELRSELVCMPLGRAPVAGACPLDDRLELFVLRTRQLSTGIPGSDEAGVFLDLGSVPQRDGGQQGLERASIPDFAL
jgi:hypothetical protein